MLLSSSAPSSARSERTMRDLDARASTRSRMPSCYPRMPASPLPRTLRLDAGHFLSRSIKLGLVVGTQVLGEPGAQIPGHHAVD